MLSVVRKGEATFSLHTMSQTGGLLNIMNTCKRLPAHACVGALGLVLLSGAGSAEAPVNGTGEILWDEYAIPHIYGPDTETVLRGFGYAQMENQAEVILTNIATARGRRAEYFGPGPNNAN